jgi:hypothetical protein
MTLVLSRHPLGHVQPRIHVGVRRALTVTEFVVLVVVFGMVVGLVVGTGIADLLTVVLQHVDRAVTAPHAR